MTATVTQARHINAPAVHLGTLRSAGRVMKTQGLVARTFITPFLARKIAMAWIDDRFQGGFISDTLTREMPRGWVFIAGALGSRLEFDSFEIPPLLVDRKGHIWPLSWLYSAEDLLTVFGDNR